MDIRDYNRTAWDRAVERGNPYTVPVSREVISAAKQGRWTIRLTPLKPVPADWFPDLEQLDVLCLASGGGQQAPVLAAAGARVTVLDNSPKQLEKDQLVAERESLDITAVEGDMTDLGMFADASFNLIIHPVSNVFVPDVRPVWAESFRVLRNGGFLLSGCDNPVVHTFDYELVERSGVIQVKYAVPYSDLTSLTGAEKKKVIDEGRPLEFGHTLDDLIGGQIDTGFIISGFYEDYHSLDGDDIVSNYMPAYIATRALKP